MNKLLCKPQAVMLRPDSRSAGNIRFKEVALTLLQTVVHLSNSCGYTNSSAYAENPPGFLALAIL
jgi:hypothetical protein